MLLDLLLRIWNCPISSAKPAAENFRSHEPSPEALISLGVIVDNKGVYLWIKIEEDTRDSHFQQDFFSLNKMNI